MAEAQPHRPPATFEPEEEWIVRCLVSGLIGSWDEIPSDIKNRVVASAAEASDRIHSEPPVAQIIADFIHRHSAPEAARQERHPVAGVAPDNSVVESIQYGDAVLVLRQIEAGWQVEVEPGHFKTKVHADRYTAQGEAEIFADNNGLGPSER